MKTYSSEYKNGEFWNGVRDQGHWHKHHQTLVELRNKMISTTTNKEKIDDLERQISYSSQAFNPRISVRARRALTTIK